MTELSSDGAEMIMTNVVMV